MTKKLTAILMMVALVVLTVAPAAQAQGYPPYFPGYSGTPLERTQNRNFGMTDGLFWNLGARNAARWGRNGHVWSPRGGYDYGYDQMYPSFFNDRSYQRYGYNNPYMYGGNDYAYDGGWRYRRHRSNEVWAAVIGGGVGFLLGRVTAPKHKSEAVPVPVEAAPVTTTSMPNCSIRLRNDSGVAVFVGSLDGRGFTLEPGQTIEACLNPTDCAYKRIDNSLVQAAFTFQGETVVIR